MKITKQIINQKYYIHELLSYSNTSVIKCQLYYTPTPYEKNKRKHLQDDVANCAQSIIHSLPRIILDTQDLVINFSLRTESM